MGPEISLVRQISDWSLGLFQRWPNLDIFSGWLFWLCFKNSFSNIWKHKENKITASYVCMRINRWSFIIFATILFFFLRENHFSPCPPPLLCPAGDGSAVVGVYTFLLCFYHKCVYPRQQTIYIVFKNTPTGVAQV